MWELRNFKKNIAVISEDGRKISYEQFSYLCDEFAERLGRERCFIFILTSNSLPSLTGYISSLNNKIVPLMLDSNLDKDLLNSLINQYMPDYVWMPENRINDIEVSEKVYSFESYLLIKTMYTKKYNLYDELALLLTTSGSTGSPKLVRQSYKNIEANTKSIVGYLELDETERPITTLPMNYTYGLSIINTHFFVGASLILTQKSIMQKDFWEQFSEYGATSFGGVPYIYEILNKIRFYRKELPMLRTMTQAGGKLTPELHKKFAEYARDNNKKFVVMYGQTEATARMSYLPYDKTLGKYGSMGIAIPGGKFSLIDVDGNVITEPEVTGELVYEGDNVTLGYAQCVEDLAKGDERKGNLITGDMAKFDKDGYYYIVGRKKRFLKMFGKRVNMDEIERLIKSEYKNIECACAGFDDNMYIFVTDETCIEDVKKYVVKKTGINHTVFTIKYIEDIPKNEAGKTLYSSLLSRYIK